MIGFAPKWARHTGDCLLRRWIIWVRIAATTDEAGCSSAASPTIPGQEHRVGFGCAAPTRGYTGEETIATGALVNLVNLECACLRSGLDVSRAPIPFSQPSISKPQRILILENSPLNGTIQQDCRTYLRDNHRISIRRLNPGIVLRVCEEGFLRELYAVGCVRGPLGSSAFFRQHHGQPLFGGSSSAAAINNIIQQRQQRFESYNFRYLRSCKRPVFLLRRMDELWGDDGLPMAAR